MNLRPLTIEKTYAEDIYFNPNTSNKYNIKEVKQVVVKYKDNTEHTYDLHYDTEYMRDMGCSSEIVKCYVLEEVKGMSVKLSLHTILNNKHEVFVVDGDKYEIQPEKELSIEDLLETQATYEEYLKDDCITDMDKNFLHREIGLIKRRIAYLKLIEEMEDVMKVMAGASKQDK